MKTKLCYILPEYKKETDTHFAYLYSFLEKIGRDLEILLVIEKGHHTIKIDSIKESILNNKKGVLFRFIKNLKILNTAFKNGYTDFYVHYSFTGALSAIFVSKIKGGRVFYWNCGMPWLYKRNLFKEFIFQFILRNSILVTGTKDIRDEYVKHYKLNSKNTRILPNWIDVDKFQRRKINKKDAREKLNLPKDKKIILFVHHLSKRKGSDLIIPTASKLKETFFVVVGDGPDKESLSRENQSNLRFEGAVPHTSIADYFSASNAFFMPSEEEGFPHVLLEAMALNLPYVASDVGGVREITPEALLPFITKDRSPEKFSELLSKMLKNPPKEGWNEKVKKYDVERIVPIFVSLFN